MAKEIKEKNPLELTEKGMALVKAIRSMGNDHTAEEIAEYMGVEKGSVNGTFTSLSTRRVKAGLPAVGERVEVTVQDEEGKESTVKFLNLTEYGLNADFVERA